MNNFSMNNKVKIELAVDVIQLYTDSILEPDEIVGHLELMLKLAKEAEKEMSENNAN